MNKLIASSFAALTVGAAYATGPDDATSHRDASAIAEDQYADNTDVYTFISPNDPNKLVIVANYIPLLIPSSGPNFYRFSDEARYEMHVDNDGDAREDVTYRWTFDNQLKNGNTYLDRKSTR